MWRLARQRKVPAAKPDGLSSVPPTQMVQGQNQLRKLLSDPSVCTERDVQK